jgi:hypothetical protein
VVRRAVAAAASHANSSLNPPGRDERDELTRKEKVVALPEVRHAQAAAHRGRSIGGGRRFR